MLIDFELAYRTFEISYWSQHHPKRIALIPEYEKLNTVQENEEENSSQEHEDEETGLFDVVGRHTRDEDIKCSSQSLDSADITFQKLQHNFYIDFSSF